MHRRIPKHAKFRFSYRKNCIINDIESRNFLGIWQDGEIIVSLPAILAELQEEHDQVAEETICAKIIDVIIHEYLHHVLFKFKLDMDHHWAIDKVLD